MSNIPNEPNSWPADSEGDAASNDLRQQMGDARKRINEHREHLASLGVSMNDSGEDGGAA